MPLTDLGPEDLVGYRPKSPAPDDFDAFWQRTLAEARAQGGAVKTERVTEQYGLRTVEVDDVRFPGWNGEPVAAWLLRPRGGRGPAARGRHLPGLQRRPRTAHRAPVLVGCRVRPAGRRHPRSGPRHPGPGDGRRHPVVRGLHDQGHRLARELLLPHG